MNRFAEILTALSITGLLAAVFLLGIAVGVNFA